MGEKNNDGGQFFTPRQVIRAMVRVIDPRIGETVYDPGSGTGGFLAQSYEHIDTADQYTTLKEHTFYGREKENLIYPVALANLVLHGIDHPHIWHGNILTGKETYGGLFAGAPELFDVVLTNPPFGGKEGKDAQTRFDYKTSATQVLYLQHVIDSLKPQGRCGIVVDEGLLFRANEDAFVKTKRKLLDECNLRCVVSLPGGVFTQAGAGVKTNLLFFTQGEPTQSIWYYDLSDLKVTKRKPLTLEHFEDFFTRLPDRADDAVLGDLAPDHHRDDFGVAPAAPRCRSACGSAHTRGYPSTGRSPGGRGRRPRGGERRVGPVVPPAYARSACVASAAATS